MGKKEIIESVREFRRQFGKQYGIERMFIFGSAARGRMTADSDIDIIVVSRKFKGIKFFKRAPSLRARWNLDYPVDFLCYTPTEFDRLRKKVTIVREAVEEGIEVN